MAEFRDYDIAGAFTQGMERGRERRQVNALNQLASQAYGASPEQQDALIRQGYAQGAQVGAGVQQVAESSEKRNYTRLGNMARLLVSMPEQARDQYYQQMKPSLESMGINVAAKPTYDAEIGSLAQQLATMYAPGQNGMPTGFRELDMKARAAGFAPGTPEYQNAIKVALGVEGRASNAGFGFKEIEGLDGRTRLARNNPRTGAVEVYDETTGNFVPMGGVAGAGGVPGAPVEAEDGTMVATTQFSDATGQPISFGADIPPEFRQAVLSQPQQFAALPDNAAATLPPVNRSPAQFRGGNPALGVSRRPEDEAAAVEAAKQGVQLGYLPTQQAIETQGAVDRARQLAPVENQAAIERARGTAQAGAEVERATAQQKRMTQSQDSIATLQQVVELLPRASGGALEAGRDRVAGAFGVSTEGAQAGAQLKLLAAKLIANVPRFEGPQSNIDVQFYREAAGDVANDQLPVGTRLAAAQRMLDIAREYSGTGQYGPAPADGGGSQLQTTSRVVDGPQVAPARRRFNPATGRLE
jgi:hypothetical protein